MANKAERAPDVNVEHIPDSAVEIILSPPHPIAVIIDEWFNSTFPGSAIAGPTENWNFLLAAKDDLKRRLAAKE